MHYSSHPIDEQGAPRRGFVEERTREVRPSVGERGIGNQACETNPRGRDEPFFKLPVAVFGNFEQLYG